MQVSRHWHKDPECPLRQGGKGKSTAQASQLQHAQVCHTAQQCYMLSNLDVPVNHDTILNEENLVEGLACCFMFASPNYTTTDIKDGGQVKAIVDTACTKSVAGYGWFEKFWALAGTRGFEFSAEDL